MNEAFRLSVGATNLSRVNVSTHRYPVPEARSMAMQSTEALPISRTAVRDSILELSAMRISKVWDSVPS